MFAGIRKIPLLLLCLTLGLQLAGCRSAEYVRLCDYKNIVIPEDVITVSDADVMLAVQMQVMEQAPDVEIETLTDDLAMRYFDADSAQEVFNTVRSEIEEHRAYDYAYSYLLNNSLLKSGNPDRSAFVRKAIEQIEKDAAGSSCTIEDYLNTAYGTTLADYKYALATFYDEFLILREFSNAEGITVTDAEFRDYLQSAASDSGVTPDDILREYGEELILYSMYLDRSYDTLLGYLNY